MMTAVTGGPPLQAPLGMYLFGGFARAPLSSYPPVTGGPPLPGVLSIYPFVVKEGQSGASLATYPSIGSAYQAPGYVNKGRRSLSSAPSGRFSDSLARRLPKICGGIFLVFPSEDSIKNDRYRLISRTADFGCLVPHLCPWSSSALMCAPCSPWSSSALMCAQS